MARDGGYCNCCGKHYIESGVDYRTGKDKELLSQHELDSIMYSATQTMVKEFKDGYKKPLLIIELQDESSVPKVIYKGEEVKCKHNVSFEWDTSGAYDNGGLSYAIEHFDTHNRQLTVNRIERRVRDHAI